MKDSGKYRVTHHLGRRPESEDAEVNLATRRGTARRFIQRHPPPRVGYVLALWRPDGTLIASMSAHSATADQAPNRPAGAQP